jgi:hypothetical protein
MFEGDLSYSDFASMAGRHCRNCSVCMIDRFGKEITSFRTAGMEMVHFTTSHIVNYR